MNFSSNYCTEPVNPLRCDVLTRLVASVALWPVIVTGASISACPEGVPEKQPELLSGGSVALVDPRPCRGGTWAPCAGQVAGLSSLNAVANPNSGPASTATS